MQRIDDVVDNLAANVEELATELRQKIAYLDERHQLLKQLEELEPNSGQSIKELRERVALLQAIARYGSSFDFEPRQPIEKLKVRIELLQTIGELEPNGPEPIKNLSERLRTLKAIQMLEPNELEPIAELRKRVQALKALKMLEPIGSNSVGEARSGSAPQRVTFDDSKPAFAEMRRPALFYLRGLILRRQNRKSACFRGASEAGKEGIQAAYGS